MNRAVIILLLCAVSVKASAQEKSEITTEHPLNILGFHVGTAFVGSLYLGEDNWTPEVEKRAVSQITFDHMLRKGFSVGATVAYQSIDISLIDTLSERALEEGKIDRIYLGGRALWHYGRSRKWDLYSGVKFGMTLYSPSGIKKNHNESSIIARKFTKSEPSIGIIPIGCRYHLSENLSLGAQLSFGAPTISTINFNYAF